MNNKFVNFLYGVQWLSGVFVVLGGIVLSLLGGINVIPPSSGIWWAIALIGSLAIYVITTNYLLETRINKSSSLSKIIGQAQWYEELIPFIVKARESIDITHHEPRLPYGAGIRYKEQLFKILEEKIKNDPNVKIRWIICINSKEKAEWAVEIVKKFHDKSNLHLRYSQIDFEKKKQVSEPPPLSVQVIDKKIVFVIDMKIGHHTRSEEVEDLICEDKAVVTQFQRYFNTYWERCKILKEGLTIYSEEVENIKNEWGLS